ncbi:hypothetical protein Tco_0329455, partial [Tanacetum coccineum]
MIVWLLSMANIIMRKDSDSDVEEDNKTSNEFMADLKRFYKRSGRVGSARKPMDKSKKVDELTKRKNDKGKGDKERSDKGLIAE